MLRTICLWACGLLVATAFGFAAVADSTSPEGGSAEKYTLRYRFEPGQTVRWEVVQRGRLRTTISGTTQTDDTVTKSVKVWKVRQVDPDGKTAFVHSVDEVDMWHKLGGSAEVRYNSKTDKKAPVGYESVAKSVGKPLTIVEMDARGKILMRERTAANTSPPTEAQMAIPLPEEPVPVGHSWSFPYDVDVALESGGVKRIKTRQRFTLESVKTGVATIRFATQILTPIHNPAIEAQLIQRESSGTARFDLEAGRILSQQTDLDKRVVGFRGPASSLHYRTRLTEKLLPAPDQTAQRAGAVR